MPILTAPILPGGLYIPALIGQDSNQLKAIQATGAPIPMPLRGRAILDTGANHTSVGPSIIAALGLSPLRAAQTQTASGWVNVQYYLISFTLYDPANPTGPKLFRSNWSVTNLFQDLPDADGIIGLDLIGQLILHIDGPAGQFTLTF